MTIDPRTYEKFSGRKGDPMMRQGAALSEAAGKQAKRTASKGLTGSERLLIGHVYAYWVKIIMALVIGALVLIGALFY